jgi:hypothetical protein
MQYFQCKNLMVQTGLALQHSTKDCAFYLYVQQIHSRKTHAPSERRDFGPPLSVYEHSRVTAPLRTASPAHCSLREAACIRQLVGLRWWESGEVQVGDQET